MAFGKRNDLCIKLHFKRGQRAQKKKEGQHCNAEFIVDYLFLQVTFNYRHAFSPRFPWVFK